MNEYVDKPEQQYYFNEMSLRINYMSQKMALKLPRTDSRFRTDLRAYEYGDVDLASDEKTRLENE